MRKHKKQIISLLVVLPLIVISICITNKYIFMREKKYQENNLPTLKIDNTNNLKPMYFVTENVTISSNVYDLNNIYLYVESSSNEEIKNNITIDNGTLEIIGDNLNVKYNEQILRTYPLIRTNYGSIKKENKTLILKKDYTYEELISNVTITNATYKVLNNDEEVTSGNITSNMKFNIYFNNYIIDSFTLIRNETTSDIDISNLTIKEDKYIIENITTVSSFITKLNTSNIVIKDKNNNELKDTDSITTSSKVTINNKEYTFVILGDITGSGNIFIGDISKLYRYYKGVLELDREYFLAGDVTYDNKISINDVAKLYQYYKGIISKLN